MKTLYLIRGLPGSGKSTLAKTLMSNKGRYIEADMFFINGEGEYVYDQNKVSAAHRWCQNQCEEIMDAQSKLHEEGYWVGGLAVSNTFTRNWEMKPYLELAEKYGYTPFVITCENNFGNIHGVGVGTLDAMTRRWEKYNAG